MTGLDSKGGWEVSVCLLVHLCIFNLWCHNIKSQLLQNKGHLSHNEDFTSGFSMGLKTSLVLNRGEAMILTLIAISYPWPLNMPDIHNPAIFYLMIKNDDYFGWYFCCYYNVWYKVDAQNMWIYPFPNGYKLIFTCLKIYHYLYSFYNRIKLNRIKRNLNIVQ